MVGTCADEIGKRWVGCMPSLVNDFGNCKAAYELQERNPVVCMAPRSPARRTKKMVLQKCRVQGVTELPHDCAFCGPRKLRILPHL